MSRCQHPYTFSKEIWVQLWQNTVNLVVTGTRIAANDESGWIMSLMWMRTIVNVGKNDQHLPMKHFCTVVWFESHLTSHMLYVCSCVVCSSWLAYPDKSSNVVHKVISGVFPWAQNILYAWGVSKALTFLSFPGQTYIGQVRVTKVYRQKNESVTL